MTRDEEEVLELAKQHSSDLGYISELGNGEPVFYEFGKDGLLQFAMALRAQLEAFRAEIERMRWQPIETAPTDGTKVLLARIGKNEVGEDLGIWWACSGFWSTKWNNWNDGVEPSGLASPTHWLNFSHIKGV